MNIECNERENKGSQGNECKARRKGATVNVSPHLGRVPYGAKELQRVYIKQMSLALIFAVALTLAILSSLRFIIDPEAFSPPPQHVIRIFNYAEIELPHSFSNVEIGMSAYPDSSGSNPFIRNHFD